jgi:hypothetical protein
MKPFVNIRVCPRLFIYSRKPSVSFFRSSYFLYPSIRFTSTPVLKKIDVGDAVAWYSSVFMGFCNLFSLATVRLPKYSLESFATTGAKAEQFFQVGLWKSTKTGVLEFLIRSSNVASVTSTT